MRKLFLAACLFLAAGLPTFGQGGFTTVSGTITGPDGLVWSCGTISAQLVTAGGAAPTLNGGSFTTQTSPVGLGCPTAPGTGANGSFTMRLADSGVIVPSTTTWRFTVNMAPGILPPAGTGAQSFTYTTAINCSTNTPSTCTSNAMSITTQLSALAPALSNSASSGGVGAGAAPVIGFYLSNNCPVADTSSCYYTPANAQQANDCSYTISTALVTCATAHFFTTDVNKRIMGYKTCSAFSAISSNNNNDPITTGAQLTIATYNSPTSITMSGNASQTVSGNVACVIWASPDDSGASAMDTAMQAALQCPRGHLANAYYWFNVPHFFTNPTACKNLGPTYPAAAGAGNMFYAAGFEWDGRGPGTAVIFIPPGFPETGTCNNGLSGNACFVVVVEGRVSNIMITGGGNYSSSVFTNHNNLMEVDGPASLDWFTCINFGVTNAGTGGESGVGAYVWAQLYQVNISGCGDASISTNVSSSVTAIKVSVDNPGTFGWNIGALTDYYSQTVAQFSKYNLICYDCLVFSGVGLHGSSYALMNNNGLAVKAYNLRLSPYFFPAVTNVVGYQCATTGCLLDAQDTYADMTGNGTNAQTGWIALKCLAKCTNHIENSIFKGTSGGFGYSDGVATSSLFDMGGGNVITPVSIAGNVYGSPSATGTALATSNVGLTTGWSTSTVSSVGPNGDNHRGVFTITAAGTPAASPTITLTFPNATGFIVAPSFCTLAQTGGTLGVVTVPLNAAGTPTTTNVLFTLSGTAVATQTYTFAYTCN
jgi:hypothetical protein